MVSENTVCMVVIVHILVALLALLVRSVAADVKYLKDINFEEASQWDFRAQVLCDDGKLKCSLLW